MGQIRTNAHPFAAVDTPSLHDLLDRVTADEQLDPRRKADLRSAIKTVAQWLGSDLTAMPAHPRYLREQLAGFQPAAAGVSRKRLQNVRSAIAFALDRYGLGGRRSYLAPLSPAAQALYDRLPDKYFRCRLSRLLHFISAQGIEPEQMTDAVADEFLAALEQHSAIKHVRTTHQDACRAWNKARDLIPGWPDVELTVPCYQQTWGLPWAAFPASLEAVVDAYFADPIDDGDFFADNGRMKPLSPRTVTTQKDHLRCTASALVRTGHEPSAIVDLGYLVQPAHVRQALQFFLDRNDGKANAYIGAIAYTLRTVAKYGVVLPDDDRKEVERLYKKVARQRHGMTDKNLERLRQFDDPAVRDLLLAFPTLRIREVLRSDSGGVAEALVVQAAVATELWLFVPLRIANFAALRLDQHLIRRQNRRGERPWAIHVPAAMVKNLIDLDYEVPPPIARHLELYLERFRPRLVVGANPWLFPGRDGKGKHVATLRSQVTRAVRQGTGIELHPHLFRHIAGKLLLDEHPGDQGTVQRMLGHKSIRTTMATYTGAETRAAIRRYDEVVLGLRAQALSRAGVAA
jgi:integrase